MFLICTIGKGRNVTDNMNILFLVCIFKVVVWNLSSKKIESSNNNFSLFFIEIYMIFENLLPTFLVPQ